MSILTDRADARRRANPPRPPAVPSTERPEFAPVALDGWAAALASVEWLLDHLDLPSPHVQAVLAHLECGRKVANCPCLSADDRVAIVDLVERRMGRVEPS